MNIVHFNHFSSSPILSFIHTPIVFPSPSHHFGVLFIPKFIIQFWYRSESKAMKHMHTCIHTSADTNATLHFFTQSKLDLSFISDKLYLRKKPELKEIISPESDSDSRQYPDKSKQSIRSCEGDVPISPEKYYPHPIWGCYIFFLLIQTSLGEIKKSPPPLVPIQMGGALGQTMITLSYR